MVHSVPILNSSSFIQIHTHSTYIYGIYSESYEKNEELFTKKKDLIRVFLDEDRVSNSKRTSWNRSNVRKNDKNSSNPCPWIISILIRNFILFSIQFIPSPHLLLNPPPYDPLRWMPDIDIFNWIILRAPQESVGGRLRGGDQALPSTELCSPLYIQQKYLHSLYSHNYSTLSGYHLLSLLGLHLLPLSIQRL